MNKTLFLRDLFTDEKVDLFIFTETCLTRNDGVVLQDLIPEKDQFVQLPRDSRRGSVDIVVCGYIKTKKTVFHSFENFQCLEVHLRCFLTLWQFSLHDTIWVCNIMVS